MRAYGACVEDACSTCAADHIDIWVESDCDSRDEVLACKDNWTPDDPVNVEINPPADRPVSTVPVLAATAKAKIGKR